MEPKLEDIIMKLASEPSLVTILPLSVDDFKGYILVGGSRGYLQYTEITVV